MSSIVCNQCKNEIKTATYVKCYNCNAKYHFSTCSPLSEFTYSTMTAKRKQTGDAMYVNPEANHQTTYIKPSFLMKIIIQSQFETMKGPWRMKEQKNLKIPSLSIL